MYCCTVTSAIHLEVTEDYSTDSLLLCFKRFFNTRGTPARITSDPGTQLMAIAELTKSWDYSKIHEWLSDKSIEWIKIPTASQHYNGCAEALIKVTKRVLQAHMQNKVFTFGEFSTLFTDIMFIVNSRPLMITPGEDPLSGHPITPLHLMLGRATIQIPDIKLDSKASLTKRCAFLERVKQEFWEKWFITVFPELISSYKRTKEMFKLEM